DGSIPCPFPCIRRCLVGASVHSAPRSRTLCTPAVLIGGHARAGPAPGGLQELQALQIDQALALVQDVSVAQALEELPRPVEVAHPDLYGPETLRDVAVRAGARDQPVLVGKALCLLVE